MTVLPQGKITEEALKKFQERVGIQLRIDRQNELASREDIKK